MRLRDNLLMISDVSGTLQPALAIEKGIHNSHLRRHVGGVATLVDIKSIWGDRLKSTSAKELILHLDNEGVPLPSTFQPRKADPGQPATVRVF